MSDQATVDIPRELAQRASDGIEVTLLWTKLENHLSVLVHDSRSGDRFELAPENDRALEVFYHPYAYAAS